MTDDQARAANAALTERLTAAEAGLVAAREALRQIRDGAKWYADNDARDPQEVDHELCVQVLDTAEKALAALLPEGQETT